LSTNQGTSKAAKNVVVREFSFVERTLQKEKAMLHVRDTTLWCGLKNSNIFSKYFLD